MRAARSSQPRPAASLLVSVVLGAGACVPAATTLPGETDRRSFTAHVVDAVVAPLLERAVTEAEALRRAAVSQDRGAAQAAWRALMTTWQALEVLHVGPAGSPTAFVGGEGLRDGIYAWPQVNPCAIDAQLAQNTFEADGWASQRLPNVIGLGALEYVLFVGSDANACPADAALNAQGTWAALGADAVGARRMRYAAVVAEDVERRVRALHGAWAPGSNTGFAAALRTAGEPGSAFPTAQQALDELYAAMFAVELTTKDKRLGLPAGLHAPAGGEACPGGCVERAESRFARASKDNVLQNLTSVRAVFVGVDAAGVDGPGLDDLLRARGALDLAVSMTANLDAAIAAVSDFPGSIEDALVSEPARVVALYDVVKGFTDDFKSTFPSALGLRVPEEGAGDND